MLTYWKITCDEGVFILNSWHEVKRFRREYPECTVTYVIQG